MNFYRRLLYWVRHVGRPRIACREESGSLPHDNQIGAQQKRFFDIVSEDALFVLVKYLSEKPHSERWVKTVYANDALTVLQVGGALSTLSREMFKSLDYNYFKYGSLREHKLLTKIMAPHLECLTLNEPKLRRFNYERLCSLRVLRFRNCIDGKRLERILAACGDSLIELDINERWMTERMVQTIARHCKSLKVFSSGSNYYDYQASFEPIWSAIGRTLIELRCRVPERELVHIARHCIGIEKLELWNLTELTRTAVDAVIELLRALKSLQTLNFGWVSFREVTIDNVRMLLDVCPSDVHINLSIVDSFADYIRVIGTRLHRLSLDYEVGSMEKLPRDVLPAFANIEQLSLFPNLVRGNGAVVFSAELESIFAEPMPNLRDLYIIYVIDSAILAVLARTVSNLRKFCFYFGSRFIPVEGRVPVKGSDFTELLQANKHLRRIGLDYGSFQDSQSMIEEIADFIPRLKPCKYLKEVDIEYKSEDGENCEKYEKISDSCVSLRTKSLSLTVNDVRYLPS